jgi:hypothetical protein
MEVNTLGLVLVTARKLRVLFELCVGPTPYLLCSWLGDARAKATNHTLRYWDVTEHAR